MDKVKDIKKKTMVGGRKEGREAELGTNKVKTISSFISLLGTPSDVHSARLQEGEDTNVGNDGRVRKKRKMMQWKWRNEKAAKCLRSALTHAVTACRDQQQ